MEINNQLEAPAALTPDTAEYETVSSAGEKSTSPFPGFLHRIVKPVA